MSENIIRFVGDTTTRSLWENGPTGSTGFSRILNQENRNFSMVAFQQAKPILDSEMNLTQLIQNKARADLIRTILEPGIISIKTTTNVTDKKNTLRISEAVANMNGWLLYLYGANRTDTSSDIVFTSLLFIFQLISCDFA